MSYIYLIIVSENKVCHFSVHYRTAMKLLDNGILNTIKLLKDKKFVDAGYLLIDFDRNQIINAQNAFPLRTIKKLNQMECFDINLNGNV